MDFPCSPPMLAGALLLAIGANSASAQTYRPDAEGYPCARTTQLAVVQSETGFSIRDKADRAAPLPPPRPAAIKLGNSLTLDSRIFARISLVRPEFSDVPQR